MSGILLLVFKNPPKFRRVGGLWRERRKIFLNLIELGGSNKYNMCSRTEYSSSRNILAAWNLIPTGKISDLLKFMQLFIINLTLFSGLLRKLNSDNPNFSR